MSELKVDKITPRQGTTLTLGDSGDTINFGSGVLPNFENLTVTGDLTVDTNSLKVDSTNNFVGIGTASPSTTLHLAQSLPQIRLEDTDTGAYGTISGQSTAGSLFIRADDGNTVANSVLGFSVDNDQKMTITSSGNVGIGESSPSAKLHITVNSVGAYTPFSEGDDLIIEGTETGIGFVASTVGASNIAFGDTDNTKAGRINYNHSTDAMRFFTNDGERMRIDSSGNVGIGVTSMTNKLVLPNASYFAMQDTSNLESLAIRANTSNAMEILTGGSVKMTIDSSGNVGIGTTNPVNALDIASNNPVLRITDTDGATRRASLGLETAGGPWVMEATDNLSIRYSNPGVAATNGSFITLGRITSPLIFGTNATEAMRIDSSGNVGIGTSSPSTLSKKLTVKHSSNATENFPSSGEYAVAIYNAHDAVNQGGLVVGNRWYNSNTKIFEVGNLWGAGSGNWYSYYIIDGIGQSIWSNNNTERMRIDSSGNVGIGTTSPDEILHISGADATFVIQESSNAGNGNAIGKIVFKSSNGNNNSMINMEQIGGSSGGELVFSTRPYTGTLAERMRIKSNGDIFFKNTTESAINGGSTDGKFIDNADGCRLRSSRASTSTREHIIFYNPNGDVGDISTSGTSTSYNTSSDYRLKENVVNMTGATDRLKQLQPKRFNFIADADTTVDGFLAHEVLDIVPEAITGTHNEVEVWKEGEELPEGVSVGDNKLDDEGNTIPIYQGIDQSKLVPLLVATIKELEARIEALENA